jgi:hypothetical protein
MSEYQTTDFRRRVEAPLPTGLFSRQSITSASLSVLLSENEEVEWVWTHTRNGSYVSGYKICPKVAA